MARVRQNGRRGGSSMRSRNNFKRPRSSTNNLSPPFKKARITRSTNRHNTIQMQRYRRSLASMQRYNDMIKELNSTLIMELKIHQNIRNKVKKVINLSIYSVELIN